MSPGSAGLVCCKQDVPTDEACCFSKRRNCVSAEAMDLQLPRMWVCCTIVVCRHFQGVQQLPVGTSRLWSHICHVLCCTVYYHQHQLRIVHCCTLQLPAALCLILLRLVALSGLVVAMLCIRGCFCVLTAVCVSPGVQVEGVMEVGHFLPITLACHGCAMRKGGVLPVVTPNPIRRIWCQG